MIGHPLKVRDLLEEISLGEVLLPEIQRSYVWRGPQVTRFLDSLYKEYPTGQILLWDTINLPITKNLEGVTTPALPTVGKPKIVLDGQQRLTSLYKVFGSAESRLNVSFNIETEQFQLYLKRLDADKRWVSVRTVINGERHELEILDEIGSQGITAEQRKTYLDRLQRLRKINEYKFPIEIFRSDDYDVVTELFIRINSAGTRLRAAELALAQLALRLPGAIVRMFEEAMDSYSEVGYELDTRFLVRALIVIGTGQSRFRSLTDFWKKPPAEVEKIWHRTKKAVDSAVNFVRHNGRFESSEWLPSLNALLPVAAYFDRHVALAPDVERGLLRWFYIASMRGRYSGSSETAIDEDLRAVASADPISELMKKAVPPGGSTQVGAEEFDDAGWRNPLFALTYAAARKAGAKDWFTGVDIATDVVGEDHHVEIHHIFPKALLSKIGVATKDRDEIANLAFLAAKPNKQISMRSPSQYLAEIAENHPDRLKAQSIPMDRSLWKLECFQQFLASRRELLGAAINDLVKDPQ